VENESGFNWVEIPEIDFVLRIGFHVDQLTVVMLSAVTFVGMLVQIYSTGYMKGEPRYGWYYAVLSLFIASMMTLVLADNFLLLYVTWEGVGICSYLLIGFYHERRSAAEAAKKAFITTRLGDVEALFNEHLERWITGRDKARIVLFAHGGLVSESSGLAIAQKHIDWWRRNGVYPIYFVWETGLFETIGQLLERTRARSQATAPGERGVFSDWISNPIIEEAVRALQADRVWGGMKRSAQRASPSWPWSSNAPFYWLPRAYP